MANLKLVKSATALVLGASVLTSAVAVSGTDASAKTTYKVTKAGTLVNAKTNKAVKGYKSYKGKLYKNGKKLTGTYKSVFYKSGVKFTGTYNKKYYVKGKLFTGKTSKNVYYKKGVKFTGVTSYGYTYKDGKRVEGEYKGKVYKNGKLVTGLYKDVLYKKGVKVTGLDLYKDKLYKDGVLNVGLALFQDKLYKDADLANGIFTYNGVEDLYKDGVVVPTKVESVSAVNSTTVEVKGTNLHGTKLTAADITVANNTVKDVTFSADRTTATVTLKDALASDVATKVTVKDAAFDVTYKIAATTVAVTEATYDDDTANQSVAITVDGKKYTAQELIDAGYNVQFSAYAKKSGTDITTTVFGTNTATGILKTDLASTLIQAITGTAGTIPTAGQDIYVSVKLTKGTEVISSEVQKITIKNQEVAANSFVSTTLSNFGTTAPSSPTDTATFDQTSKTLVKGEYAAVSSATVKTANEEEDIDGDKLTVKTSDSTVVSVDAKGILKAQTPGTATITVTYGGATTTFTVTVKNEARELAKASVVSKASSTTEVSSKTLIQAAGAQSVGYVWALDQYGDPIETALTVVSSDESTIQAGTVNPTPVTGTTAGKTTTTQAVPFTVTTAKAGSANITFKDAAGNKVTTNAFKVSATENATIASYKLDLAPSAATDSTDLTLDLKSDNTASFVLNGYTSEGVKVSAIDLTATTASGTAKYAVTVNESKVGVLATPSVTAAGLALTAAKEGTANITIKDNETGKDIVTNVKVTVVNVGYKVTAASLKTIATPTYVKTYTYKDVLSFKEADASVDPVITGLTLSTASSYPVRLELAQSGESGSATASKGLAALYLDKDADGKFTTGDVPVGYVNISGSGDFDTTYTAANLLSATGVTVTPASQTGSLIYTILDLDGNIIAKSTITLN